MVDLNLKIKFEEDWAEYVKGDEWDKMVTETCWGLNKKRDQFSKGQGKGPGKSKSKGKDGSR